MTCCISSSSSRNLILITVAVSKGEKNFQKSGSHFTAVGTRRVTKYVRYWGPQMLCTTLLNSVAQAKWRPEFVRLSLLEWTYDCISSTETSFVWNAAPRHPTFVGNMLESTAWVPIARQTETTLSSLLKSETSHTFSKWGIHIVFYMINICCIKLYSHTQLSVF